MRAGLRPPTPPKPTPQACARPSTSRSAPAAARTRSGDYGYLVSTTVFLVDGIASAVVRDDVTCGQIWREIKGLVTAAAADRLFAPSPSNRCQWCAYFGNGCILDRPGAAGDGETAMWLEDEAGGDGGSVAR